MYKENTVFIVGAGASLSYGFPLGSKLSENIISLYTEHDGKKRPKHLVPGWDIFNDRFKALGHRHNFHQEFSNFASSDALHSITNGLHGMRSIDRFLDIHKDDENIVALGKLAIFSEILKHERASILLTDHEKIGINTYSGVDYYYTKRYSRAIKLIDSWINTFFNHLSEGYDKNTVDDIFKNVKIVCFNYDRCIEFYLYYLLKDTFQLTDEHTTSILKTLKIIHPYGSLGNSFDDSAEDYLAFGNLNYEQIRLQTAIDSITTFPEAKNNDKQPSWPKEYFADAKNIVFLGFGFEQMNMNYLSYKPSSAIGQQIFATTYKEAELSKQEIRTLIRKSLFPNTSGRRISDAFNLIDAPCDKIFSSISRSITC